MLISLGFMSYSRDESFPESLCYFRYPLFIRIFVLVLVTFLVKETGHENFILFLFVNTLLFIFMKRTSDTTARFFTM